MKSLCSRQIILGLTVLIAGCDSPQHVQRTLATSSDDPQVKEKIFPFLSAESTLRKLSYHLRGEAPSEEEYQPIDNLTSENRDSFFRNKVDEYIASREYVEKMNFRLSELFLIRPQTQFQGLWAHSTDPNPRLDYLLNFNALNDLFRSLARFNLSWDQLAIGKSYSTYAAMNGFFSIGVPDVVFFRESAPSSLPWYYVPGLQDPDPKPIPLQYDEHDPRIAGAITTTRFFARYTTTAVNKNRKRAAAIFRIFLCDDMKASIPQSEEKAKELLSLAYPVLPSNVLTENEILEIQKNKHGEDPACMACHYKLDPMGRSFETSPIHLGSVAAPGALTFKNRSNELISHEGQGLGDLMAELVKTPEYKSCQVQRFWNWFIGEDFPLSDERKNELIKVFNQLDHRTNDFVKFMVMLPEFRAASFESAGDVPYKVKNILQKCSACHSQSGLQMPSFDQWPIGGSNPIAHRWLIKIEESLGLNGSSASMPPPISAWVLSDEDKSTMRYWIRSGAPDEKGLKQIEDPQ